MNYGTLAKYAVHVLLWGSILAIAMWIAGQLSGCSSPPPVPKFTPMAPPPGYRLVAVKSPLVASGASVTQTGPGTATRTAYGVAIVWSNPPPRWTIYSTTNLASPVWVAMFNGSTPYPMHAVELYSSITNLAELYGQIGFYKLSVTP